MTDRELLELAAKAAGYVSQGYGEMVGDSPCLYIDSVDFSGMWAPLTDDGDALRLAVKLSIFLSESNMVSVKSRGTMFVNGNSRHWLWEAEKEDPYAATRRAIVRAAAEIGRTKE